MMVPVFRNVAKCPICIDPNASECVERRVQLANPLATVDARIMCPCTCHKYRSARILGADDVKDARQGSEFQTTFGRAKRE
jgi:hypothetical protein